MGACFFSLFGICQKNRDENLDDYEKPSNKPN